MRFLHLGLAAALVAAGTLAAGAAEAQRKLKFAHVYETNEPYHTNAVWAAGEIAKRTNNKYTMEVYPASSLGNEPTINQGLALGTVDIIYTGAAFAGASYKPIAISNAPYMFKDFDHWLAYSKSSLLQELMAGYEKSTGHKITSIVYYGARHTTANKAINTPADMRGMKLRVPQAPLYLMYAKAVGANATPIAFAEVYLALQQGTVDGQENPLPTIQAKKFYEVQTHINLTNHIYESLMIIVGSPLWKRLSNQEKAIFQEVFDVAAARSTTDIRASEQVLPEEFRKLGKTVVRSDLAAFRTVAMPLHNDAASGAGWTKTQYDALQALAK
ncbi:MAG: DctP family TRAP transporter solute-binding subunit [Alphaproteobacteria bacterium]|nr:DctP family TRAP transporter solute-binding subunit [Alphaproteobacteria bacterium]